MGQKTHPIGFRLGITQPWLSLWYSDKNYAEQVLDDYRIREILQTRLARAGLAKVEIERSFNDLKLILHVSRPGVVIGRGGAGIELLRADVEKFVAGKPVI